MIGVLWLVGLIATGFGVVTRQAFGEATPFVVAHVALGAAALLGAAVLGLTRIGRVRQPALYRPALRAVGGGLAASAVAVGVYFAALASEVRFDWTFEGRFEVSEATRKLMDALPAPLTLALYYDPGDPRIRHTKLLLEEIARGHDARVLVRRIDEHPDDEDRYGIGSSNSVLLRLGEAGRGPAAWELVERPTEGALYQALSGMVREQKDVLYITVGAGEGDLERTEDAGYSGLRAALESEGYAVRPLPLALAVDIPPDAAAVISIAPRRALPATAVAALERYLDEGGRLVAFVEPDTASGLERVLERAGITPLEGTVVDPASGPVEGAAPGRNPVAAAYAEHPVTRGLGSNRMTYFRGARAFRLHKVDPDDRLRAVVFTSGSAWIEQGPPPEAAGMALPAPPPGARLDYQPLVVAGELARGKGPPARIVAFGDADLAANHALRALYNLDLVLNAVHWATEREAAITIRPKIGGRQLVQFPVPLETSLRALYGVGLLVPELLLIAGGLVWLRQREA